LTTLVLVLAASTPARAEDGTERARAEFELASKYFDAEDYRAALPHFKNAYDLTNHRPTAVFALAQCERALKRYDDAIAHFEEYLGTKPPAAEAAQVKETIKRLRELRDTQQSKAEPKRALGTETPDLDAKPAENPAYKSLDKPVVEKAIETPAIKVEEKKAVEARPKPAEPVDLRVKPEPKPTPPLPAPTVVAPPPEPEHGSVLSSPILWIAAGAAIVGGAVAIGFLARSKESSYAGNSGVVIEPR
jgi:tetratricopeptide (TPR) repeat protein